MSHGDERVKAHLFQRKAMQLRTDATSDRWLATLRELDRDGSVCQAGITADDSHDCHGSQDADSGSGFSLFNVAARACRKIATKQNDLAVKSHKEFQNHDHDHGRMITRMQPRTSSRI